MSVSLFDVRLVEEHARRARASWGDSAADRLRARAPAGGGTRQTLQQREFFDRQAIPPEDFPAIAARVRGFETVIVENHPLLCGDDCLRFRDLLQPSVDLEIAIGLETVHPDVLPRLNKRMRLDDFARAVKFLRGAGIHVRAFILLRPPFLSETEGIEWALRSIDFAFDCGVRCCSVIPTRGGNGIMEQWPRQGNSRHRRFAPWKRF